MSRFKLKWSDFNSEKKWCHRCYGKCTVINGGRPGGFEGDWIYLHKCDDCGYEFWE